METQAAFEMAYAELGDGVEEAIGNCGCGGACAVCQPLIEQANRRAAELIGQRVATSLAWSPAMVAVADDRGTVAGARVTCGDFAGEVIPREGDTLDCWVDGALIDPPDGVEARAWAAALERAAAEGAAGRSGSEVLL